MAAVSHHLLGIDPKMYRHFAILAVGISTVVAIFADGETQEAIAQNNRHAELKRMDESKNGKTPIVDKRTENTRQSSVGGYNGEYGAPMDRTVNAGGNTGYLPPNMALRPPTVIIEVDQAALARMSPERRKAYFKKLEEERQRRIEQGPVVPSPQQVSALAAASAARSGSDSID